PLAGRAVEPVASISFPEYQSEHILGPLRMTNSAFLLADHLDPRLARGYLPVAPPGGGFREIPAPRFEFGILPAGNLYSTVEDLGRFLISVFANGSAGNHALVR